MQILFFEIFNRDFYREEELCGYIRQCEGDGEMDGAFCGVQFCNSYLLGVAGCVSIVELNRF